MKVIPFTIPVSENKTIIIQEDKLPFFYPYLHRHAECQLTLILRGEGILMADNNMHPFKEGDLFFIGANQPHIFKSDKARDGGKNRNRVHSLSLFFDPAGKLSALTDLPEMTAIKKWIISSRKGYRLTGKNKDKIRDIFLHTCRQAGPEQIISLLLLLKLLASSRFKEPLSTTVISRFTEAEGSRLNDIYQFSIQHISDTIPLKKIASVAHLTVPAFCRYFKKRTGKTYTRFLNELRISEAARLLISGNIESIREVAWETGFMNVPHFNRTFKQLKGCSPGKFIQQHKTLQS